MKLAAVDKLLFPRLASGVPSIPSGFLLDQDLLVVGSPRRDLLSGLGLSGKHLCGDLGRYSLALRLALGGALLASDAHGEAGGLLFSKNRIIHDGIFAEFPQLIFLRGHCRALSITKTLFLKPAH